MKPSVHPLTRRYIEQVIVPAVVAVLQDRVDVRSIEHLLARWPALILKRRNRSKIDGPVSISNIYGQPQGPATEVAVTLWKGDRMHGLALRVEPVDGSLRVTQIKASTLI